MARATDARVVPRDPQAPHRARLHRPNRDNKAAGLYKCVCCGRPLFRSKAKSDSGYRLAAPLQTVRARRRPRAQGPVHLHGAHGDPLLGLRRHLGHVFEDGPPPTGLRDCMNGVATDFEPDEA
ncbi:MAG: hypothetical protein Kow0026_23100 [Oricola sp.]